MKGLDQLPYFDKLNDANTFDPENDKIDMVLITHFHMDHSGAVPYFFEIAPHKLLRSGGSGRRRDRGRARGGAGEEGGGERGRQQKVERGAVG